MEHDSRYTKQIAIATRPLNMRVEGYGRISVTQILIGPQATSEPIYYHTRVRNESSKRRKLLADMRINDGSTAQIEYTDRLGYSGNVSIAILEISDAGEVSVLPLKRNDETAKSGENQEGKSSEVPPVEVIFSQLRPRRIAFAIGFAEREKDRQFRRKMDLPPKEVSAVVRAGTYPGRALNTLIVATDQYLELYDVLGKVSGQERMIMDSAGLSAIDFPRNEARLITAKRSQVEGQKGWSERPIVMWPEGKADKDQGIDVPDPDHMQVLVYGAEEELLPDLRGDDHSNEVNYSPYRGEKAFAEYGAAKTENGEQRVGYVPNVLAAALDIKFRYI